MEGEGGKWREKREGGKESEERGDLPYHLLPVPLPLKIYVHY